MHLNQFLHNRSRAADSMAPLVVSNQIIFAAVISAVIAMVTKVAPDNATAVNQALMTMVAGVVIWQPKTITSILAKIKVHTEVINSRTNHIEDRAMFQFAAHWHNVSPQVAYRLWQTSNLQVPPCPTSQTFWQEEGRSLVPMDQAQANQYLTESTQSVLRAQTICLQAYEARQFQAHKELAAPGSTATW